MSGQGATSSFYEEHCTYLPAMLGWFLFSSLLSTYNKYVFGSGHMAFPCPLLLTSMHFGIQWFISQSLCEIFPEYMGTERVRAMSWKEWASISIPCGMVTALDVGLSNLSLVSITITFYTMVKSSTPIFVLGWAYVFGIEKITWRLVGVIIVIALGEFLTVAGEVNFVLHGFLLCLVASCLSGARWTLVQLKLQNLQPPLKTTVVTMRLLAPSMFIGLLLISLVVERPWNKFSSVDQESDEIGRILLLGMLGGILAVSMVLCEFYLILHASAIIMMIGGVVKELTTIFIGVSLFGDELNMVNVVGCSIVFSGVLLYKVVFHLEKAERKESEIGDEDKGKLVRKSPSYEDDISYEYVSSRAVELVDRSPGKNHERRPSEDSEDLVGDDSSDEEHEHKLV